MRKSSFLYTLLFVSVFCKEFHAQGYRGRKFSLSYVPGYSMIEPPFDFKHVIAHQKINLGYSLSKHLSVNLIGSFTNTRTMTSPRYKEVQIKDITYGIGFNYFKKQQQSFAPVGRFIGFSFEFGSQNLEQISYAPPYYPGGKPIKEYYYNDQKRGDLMLFSINFGKNYLFKDRFLVGYGIQYGYCTQGGPNWRHFVKPQFNFGIIF